jgi:hypothetical protein
MGWIAEKGGFLDMDSDTQLTGNIIHNNIRTDTAEDTSTVPAGEMGALLGDALGY